MTVRQNLPPANPYFYGVPVRDPQDFFGRGEQLRTIFEALEKRESVSIVGQRRSGRTSLLYHLMTAQARRSYGLDSNDLIFVYLDPQLGMRDPQEFYGELLEALADQVPTVIEGMGSEVSQRQVRSVLRKLEPRRLVLLVDEFERLVANENFPVDFFAFLRGLSGNYEVRLVTTTAQRLCDCYWGEWESSPLYNVFLTVYLGAWTEPEFDHFLAETSRRSGVSVLAHREEILRLAGRFPFYVQMACSFCFDAWRERGECTSQSTPGITQRFVAEARPYLERIWERHLSPSEKAVLAAVAQGQQPSDKGTLERLMQQGYLVNGHMFSSVLTDAIWGWGTETGDEPPPTSTERETEAIRLDKKSGDVWVAGKPLAPLTNLEYRLLLCLSDNAGCICSKYDIVEAVWGGSYIDQVDDSRIAKLVSRLRRSVEPDAKKPRYVVTVHGRGYKLVQSSDL
jgi:DNA-binding response OmpR family regulator